MSDILIYQKRKPYDKFLDLVSFGENNNKIADKLCAFLLALCPILQHYIGLFDNAAVTILIFLLPYLTLKMFVKYHTSRISMSIITPLVIFLVFKVINHGISTNDLANAVILTLFFLAVANGCINVKLFIKISIYIAVIAGIILMAQYICYYILNFHLQLVATDLLLEKSNIWVMLARTGLIGITGRSSALYRPSAFFLEPSHLFIYSFPALLILLLPPNINSWRIKMAIIISAALFLSTSGMGIGITVIAWALYFSIYRGRDNIKIINKLLSPSSVILILTLMITLIALYNSVDFFRLSVNRFFFNETGRNAFDGRTSGGISIIRTLKGSNFWFGVSGTLESVDYHMAGFFATFYKHGLIGVILSYIFYIKSMFILKVQYLWISVIIVGISFFTAHTHGTFYMLFYVIILMDGYYSVKIKNASKDIITDSNLVMMENT